MNKNLFKTFAIAAMAVLAGACAKEQVGSADGETVEMTFNVDVPETTITTKGLSDAAQVDELICQVFLKGAKDENKHFVYTPVPELTQNVAVVGGKATVKFSLVKGQTYSFAFWAQTSETGYYNTDDLRSVTMNTNLVKANDPKMDAFFAIKDEARVTVSYSKKVSLKRALAQVNFGTKKYSGRSDELKAQKSYVTLTGVPNVFHPFMSGDSFACEGSETVKFNENEVISNETLSVNDAEYSYLASVYVFALNPNNTITDASAVVTLSNGKTTTIKAPNVPVKRNFRTNILGDLLTVDAVWNVDVAPEFEGGDTYDSVAANLEAGKEVTLSEDYFVADKSKGVTLGVGVTSVLNLNGKKFSNENGLKDNKAALQVHGDLTINGDGEVYCKGYADNNAIIVEQGGHLVINGGTYNVGKANSGKSNATIFVLGPDKQGRNGSVEINGGVFMAEAGSDGTPFVLNQHDDITVNCFSVKGGTFVGFNPANVNEAKGDITSFVAEGYKSVKISESPETWQVVDASKTISDQAGLNSALGEASTGDYLKLPAGTYTLPELTKSVEGVTFEGKLGADGNPLTVIDLASVSYLPSGSSCNYNNVTFKNIQFKTWPKDAKYKGFQHSGNLLFEGCTFTGIHFSYGNETYKKCKFIQEKEEYNMWVYGGTTVDYIDCTFEGKGKFLHVYNEGSPLITVNIQGCKFISTVLNKPAINIKGTSTTSAVVVTELQYTVNIDNCTVSGAFPEINGGLWQVDKPATAEKNKITVNVK